MEFFTEFPELGRRSQMELRKGIDLAFRNFSKEYGDGIDAFFDPLLFFLVSLEKLLLATPWIIIIGIICGLAWLGSRSWKLVVGSAIAFLLIGYFGMWEGLYGNSCYYYSLYNSLYCRWNTYRNCNVSI